MLPIQQVLGSFPSTNKKKMSPGRDPEQPVNTDRLPSHQAEHQDCSRDSSRKETPKWYEGFNELHSEALNSAICQEVEEPVGSGPTPVVGMLILILSQGPACPGSTMTHTSRSTTRGIQASRKQVATLSQGRH